METEISKKIYTRKEAAEYLRISTATLDRVVKAGKIKTIQFVPKGKVFFKKESIEAFIQEQE